MSKAPAAMMLERIGFACALGEGSDLRSRAAIACRKLLASLGVAGMPGDDAVCHWRRLRDSHFHAAPGQTAQIGAATALMSSWRETRFEEFKVDVGYLVAKVSLSSR